MSNRTYLGDGLYADFDGYQIRLWTDRETGEHEVFLEPETLAKFLAYIKSLEGTP